MSTKEEARKFGHDLPRNLRRIQDQLRKGYRFSKAHGATPSKGAGKTGKRPIVVAPLPDRIVQRAILDVLQDAVDLSRVHSVLSTPTSVGGIRGRGVDTAIELFDARILAGDRFVAGSDISGFFTKIPRGRVIDFLRLDTSELEFLDLVTAALTVELANAETLGADERKLFPTGSDGVAQGCPLSALAGNIVLRDFDAQMNDPARGITCIRYIDDFILVGRSQENVRKALASAKVQLAALGMDIYDPVTNPTKAFIGAIGEPHVFLGYQLIPDRYPPSDAACQSLLARIDALMHVGKASIRKVVDGRTLTAADRCYAQTLAAIDNTVKGWRGSFRSSRCLETFGHLDKQVERKMKDFDAFFRTTLAGLSFSQRRRALGVGLLAR
ncbi:MAG: reverse transcriptase domain-containing protein [Croceibacterium sp.]